MPSEMPLITLVTPHALLSLPTVQPAEFYVCEPRGIAGMGAQRPSGRARGYHRQPFNHPCPAVEPSRRLKSELMNLEISVCSDFSNWSAAYLKVEWLMNSKRSVLPSSVRLPTWIWKGFFNPALNAPVKFLSIRSASLLTIS
ncbi:hypothetical protein B0H17DRAFT_1125704 [Mycena rosella]|uniref:Uncharacterized protein n=1 Tax=Mycena rosella TaxID=1033263 RepID=A0AAD7GX15_MYCRO|nr:hypothetical protein B0H17DRAFT_1125704 [Mycena rosella]